MRHDLVQHMVNSIQRLGFSAQPSLDHRKLAVELAEVIIKWELCGIKEENWPADGVPCNISKTKKFFKNQGVETGLRRSVSDDRSDRAEPHRKKLAVASSGGPIPVPVKSTDPAVPEHIDKRHTDTVLNFLLRLACQVSIWKLRLVVGKR